MTCNVALKGGGINLNPIPIKTFVNNYSSAGYPVDADCGLLGSLLSWCMLSFPPSITAVGVLTFTTFGVSYFILTSFSSNFCIKVRKALSSLEADPVHLIRPEA
jgi:hypothetical protein